MWEKVFSLGASIEAFTSRQFGGSELSGLLSGSLPGVLLLPGFLPGFLPGLLTRWAVKQPEWVCGKARRNWRLSPLKRNGVSCLNLLSHSLKQSLFLPHLSLSLLSYTYIFVCLPVWVQCLGSAGILRMQKLMSPLLIDKSSDVKSRLFFFFFFSFFNLK